MEKVKSSVQCCHCLGFKTENWHFFYIQNVKYFICQKCTNNILVQRTNIELEAKESFSKKEVINVLKESIKELNKIFFSSNENFLEITKEINIKKQKIKILSLTSKELKDIKSFDLVAIKSIPPQTLLSKEEKNSGPNFLYKCPLHNEKTASFNWYKKTKTFYCFGCHEHGSIIDLYMKLNNCDFKAACQNLTLEL